MYHHIIPPLSYDSKGHMYFLLREDYYYQLTNKHNYESTWAKSRSTSTLDLPRVGLRLGTRNSGSLHAHSLS